MVVMQTREEAGAQTRGHLTLDEGVRPAREGFIRGSIVNHSHYGIITVNNIIKQSPVPGTVLRAL